MVVAIVTVVIVILETETIAEIHAAMSRQGNTELGIRRSASGPQSSLWLWDLGRAPPALWASSVERAGYKASEPTWADAPGLSPGFLASWETLLYNLRSLSGRFPGDSLRHLECLSLRDQWRAREGLEPATQNSSCCSPCLWEG